MPRRLENTPPPVSARRDATYPLRMMAALAASLLLVVIAARLPIDRTPGRVGWTHTALGETIILEDPRLQTKAPEKADAGTTPITVFTSAETETPDGPGTDAQDEATPDADPSLTAEPRTLPDIPLERMVLAFAEEMPTIQGGLGAYYINIDYPRAAIDAGIEGRLVLDFIVEPDGRATHVNVLQSLHPLCDSAAVQALRKTVFMPGRQNGEIVPVRMRLPVKFRLIAPAPADSSSLPPSS